MIQITGKESVDEGILYCLKRFLSWLTALFQFELKKHSLRGLPKEV